MLSFLSIIDSQQGSHDEITNLSKYIGLFKFCTNVKYADIVYISTVNILGCIIMLILIIIKRNTCVQLCIYTVQLLNYECKTICPNTELHIFDYGYSSLCSPV